MSLTAHLFLVSVLLCGLCLLGVPGSASVPYTHANGLDALYFAKAAYCPEDAIRSWTCGTACMQHSNFRVLAVIRKDDLSLLSYVGVDDDRQRVVVAFRGASELKNMIGSAGVLPVTLDKRLGCGDNCKVHAVYQSYYENMRYFVRRYVVGALQWNPSYSVLVTGNSMGGGLSLLAAPDLQTQIDRYGFSPRPLVHLYTFGALRVSNKAYSAWAVNLLGDAAHFRVTHRYDPVPRFPPFPSLFGYVHVPQEIYYPGNDNVFVVCDDSVSAESKSCNNAAKNRDNNDHSHYLGVTTGCED